MPFRGRPHQRVLLTVSAPLAFTSAPRSSSIFTSSTLPDARRDHQRGLAVPARDLRIGAGFEQLFRERSIAVGQRQSQRRLPVVARGVDFRACGDQLFGHVLQIEKDGPGQRGRAVGSGGVDVRVPAARSASNGLGVATLDRVDEAQSRRPHAVAAARPASPNRGSTSSCAQRVMVSMLHAKSPTGAAACRCCRRAFPCGRPPCRASTAAGCSSASRRHSGCAGRP